MSPPAGIAQLAERLAEAGLEHETAVAASSAADKAAEGARDARSADAASRRADLERAAAVLDDIAGLRGRDRRALTPSWPRQPTCATTPPRSVDAARGHLEHTQAERDRIARTDLAAALRPQLVAGADCPVCAQPVNTLPPPLPAADLERAELRSPPPKPAASTAETAFATAERAHGRIEDEKRLLARRIDEQRTQLAGLPDDRDAVGAELARIEQLNVTEAEAGRACANARSRLTRPPKRSAGRDRAAERGQAAGRSPRPAVVGLGAPPAGQDVAAGWQQLSSWAEAATRERRERLTAARGDVDVDIGS